MPGEHLLVYPLIDDNVDGLPAGTILQFAQNVIGEMSPEVGHVLAELLIVMPGVIPLGALDEQRDPRGRRRADALWREPRSGDVVCAGGLVERQRARGPVGHGPRQAEFEIDMLVGPLKHTAEELDGTWKVLSE